MRYRCYLLGPDHAICAANDIFAETIGEALAAARRLSAQSPHPAFELWSDTALIYRGVKPISDDEI